MWQVAGERSTLTQQGGNLLPLGTVTYDEQVRVMALSSELLYDLGGNQHALDGVETPYEK
jgi:hypothetical protein